MSLLYIYMTLSLNINNVTILVYKQDNQINDDIINEFINVENGSNQTIKSIELPEIGRPLLPGTWRDINTMTISYGHGIAVSPVQLAAAIGSLVNGGMLRPATLLRHEAGTPIAGEQVISPETSDKMRTLMRLVVAKGTGRKAAAKGYYVGGKTGTAEKQFGGRYKKSAKISSFVGAFPIHDPRYVVFAMVDEPIGNKRTFNYATGGWVAAPIVGRVVSQIGPLLGIEPLITGVEPLALPMIDDERRKQKISSGLEDIVDEIEATKVKIQVIDAVNKSIQSKNVDVAKENSSISELEKFNVTLNTEVKHLEEGHVDGEDYKEVKTLKEEFDVIGNEKDKLREERVYNEAARSMLTDQGIKTKVIKQYLPIMNKLINTYLTSMEFYVNFTLDDNFNETIKSRYRDDFTYASFSEGEKMRIDLALLFTWRAVAKMKNSANTNLLILDEIFDSSLDGTGTDEFLKILNTLGDENVFVISHKQDALADKFRSTIKFEKTKNFSHIKE